MKFFTKLTSTIFFLGLVQGCGHEDDTQQQATNVASSSEANQARHAPQPFASENLRSLDEHLANNETAGAKSNMVWDRSLLGGRHGKRSASKDRDGAAEGKGKHGGRRHKTELSPQEVQKNKEQAEKKRELALAEARKNVDNPDAAVRLNAISDLDVNDSHDLAAFSKVLKQDADQEIRKEAIIQLGLGEPSKVTPLLLDALNDADPSVVTKAISVLGQLDALDRTPIFNAIKNIANNHRDEEVRAVARDELSAMQ